ncbi:hypothetical protein [Streptomyces acidiscabies]|uniref:hypothetical protein n=1 Tax=Streptomyces acidiscabies TaxID=42234 RepID=UPI0038F6F46E
MPTDEGTHGVDADEAQERTGPRHAAPRKPLFARLHMPAGKAIALAAMPTVLVGMGLTSTLARAEGQQPVSSSKSLTAEEYQACVEAMAKDPDASPSPSASESSSSGDEKKDEASGKDSTASDSGSDEKSSAGSEEKGADDKAASPSPSASDGKTEESGGGVAASPSPSPSASAPASASEESKGLLESIGDAITDVFTGGDKSTPSASPSPSASPGADSAAGAQKETTEKAAGDAAKESPAADEDKASPSPSPSASESSAPSDDEKKDDGKKDDEEKADASPSPSPSASTDLDGCPAVATDDEAEGIDNKMRLPDDPWYLNASGLTLKGADYQGIVKVKTANGTVKEVLKYVISDGTDIDDLHQTVNDKQAGKTYHVKGAKGSKSTITGGDTIMYTESISGNLFGLLPVTFSPKSPPPLNIPWIYFSNVKVVQAGQFGGTLTIPGMSQSIT